MAYQDKKMFPGGVKKYFSSNKDLYPSGGIPVPDKMETHAKHHSDKHMNVMKKQIKKGNTFTKAHKTAMNKVGS